MGSIKMPVLLQRWTAALLVPLLFTWAFIGNPFRDSEGFLDGNFMFPVAIALACVVLAWSAGKPWRISGAWLALGIVGQAAALQLIDAGPRLHYQHFITADLLSTTNGVFFSLIVMQALLVYAELIRRRQQLIVPIRTSLKWWQIAGIAFSLVIFSTTLSPTIPAYAKELLAAGFVQTLNLFTIILAVASLPDTSAAYLKQKFNRLFGAIDADAPAEPGNIDRYALLLALFVTVVSATLNLLAYDNHPHIADEVVYLFHAKYLAQGMQTLPLPPVLEAFNMDLMMYEDNRWYCPVVPGWPALLAVGSYFGVPWLVNPLLGGLSVLLAYMVLREIFNKGLSRLILLLFTLSPWQILLAMSFLTHTASLVTSLLATLAVARMRRNQSLIWAIIGGIGLGVTSWIRPLEGLAVAVLLGLWCFGIKGWNARFRLVPVLVLSSIAVGGLMLPYNQMLTGKPTYFPIMAFTDKYYGEGSNSLGFGPEKGLGWGAFDPFPGHGLLDVVINNNLNLFSVNIELFGWSTGSLFLVVVLLLSAKMRRPDYWMLSVLLMIIGLHCMYWFSGGPDFGARYWYLTLLPWIVLSARGLLVLGPSAMGLVKNQTRLLSFILTLSILATINYIPWRAIDKYHNYRDMRSDIRHLATENNFKNSLILIRGERDPGYMSVAVYNDPVIQPQRPIYAWDKNPEIRARLLETFPNRDIWLVDAPSLTGAGYRIVKGPVSAIELAGSANER